MRRGEAECIICQIIRTFLLAVRHFRANNIHLCAVVDYIKCQYLHPSMTHNLIQKTPHHTLPVYTILSVQQNSDQVTIGIQRKLHSKRKIENDLEISNKDEINVISQMYADGKTGSQTDGFSAITQR